MTKGDMPKIAVVGAGHWGKNLVRNMHALGALAAVCDASPETREALAHQYPGCLVARDIEQIWADDTLRAVMIATPASTHGALVAAALRAGKHVFVEKPLCLDLSEAEALKAEARRAGRVLMVGHLLLYHPAFRALRKTVLAGDLGTIRYIYSNRASLGKIRREENALWSFAPHDVSMILQLVGRMPLSVACSGGQYLSNGVADTTLSHLDFGHAVQAHIFVSWLHPYKDQRLVVIGSDAMAVFDDVAAGPDKLILYRHRASWDGDIPIVHKAEGQPIPCDVAEPLRVECQTFLDAVRGDAVPPSDADEGIRVLRVLDACQRALSSGERIRLGP